MLLISLIITDYLSNVKWSVSYGYLLYELFLWKSDESYETSGFDKSSNFITLCGVFR